MATTRDHFQNVDYLLIDQHVVASLGISIEANPGETADPVANKTWHRDLTRLTASHLAELARACRRLGQTGRCLQKDVRALILAGVRGRQIQVERMNQILAAKVREAMQADG